MLWAPSITCYSPSCPLRYEFVALVYSVGLLTAALPCDSPHDLLTTCSRCWLARQMFNVHSGFIVYKWGPTHAQGTLQSAPTPPVGSQHSCQPTVKLHILPLVWIFTLGKGWYGGTGGQQLKFACMHVHARYPISVAAPMCPRTTQLLQDDALLPRIFFCSMSWSTAPQPGEQERNFRDHEFALVKTKAPHDAGGVIGTYL